MKKVSFILIFFSILFFPNLFAEEIRDTPLMGYITLTNGSVQKYIILSEDEKFLKVVPCDSYEKSQDTLDFIYIDKEYVESIERYLTPQHQLLESHLMYPENMDNFIVTPQAIYDKSGENPLLTFHINIWNTSDSSIEIQDIILKDQNQLMLFPLSPEEVAYLYLGEPPADLPILPPSSPEKKFIVTGNIRKIWDDYYKADFEIEERKAGESFLESYLRGLALGQAIKKAKHTKNFKVVIRSVISCSFKTDKIPPHTQIEGTIFYHRGIFYYPLDLEIYLKNSEGSFSCKYKIYP